MLWSRVPWSRVGAMQLGNIVGNNEGPFRACCIIQCIPSQEPLAHIPALSTWPHPAPTGLAGCLSSHQGSPGYPEWGPLDSRFPSHLILCVWQTMSLRRQRPSPIAPSPCAPPASAPSSASAPRRSWGGASLVKFTHAQRRRQGSSWQPK